MKSFLLSVMVLGFASSAFATGAVTQSCSAIQQKKAIGYNTGADSTTLVLCVQFHAEVKQHAVVVFTPQDKKIIYSYACKIEAKSSEATRNFDQLRCVTRDNSPIAIRFYGIVDTVTGSQQGEVHVGRREYNYRSLALK